jgi:hypothetical protein
MMAELKPPKPKRTPTGPRKLSDLAETALDELLKQGDPVLAAKAWEAMMRIYSAWPDARSRATPGGVEDAADDLMTAADVEAAKAAILTEDEWIARYSPKT